MIMSKIKNFGTGLNNVIIFKPSIEGHPGGVDFYVVCLNTGRRCCVVHLPRNKSLSNKKCQIKYVWDKNVVINLGGLVIFVPCLFQKAKEWWEINERVT